VSLTIYRERTEVDIVAESPALSRGRMRLYVQHALGDGVWQKSAAASAIWHQPGSGESSQTMPAAHAEMMAEALEIDVVELVRRAEAYWRKRDEEITEQLVEKGAR
jgi:hypothetical protein